MKRKALLFSMVLMFSAVACTGNSQQASKEYEFESLELQLESRGTTIPATMVVPIGEEDEIFPLVVMHHGHGGGRNENGGFAKIAEALAKKGIITIRMDFAGAGDSKEPFENLTHTSMIADSNAALYYAVMNAPVDAERIGTIGYSEGSIISATLAGYPFSPYKAVALIGPVANVIDVFANSFGGQEAFMALYEEAKENGYAVVTTPWGQVQNSSLQWFNESFAAKPLEWIKNFKGDILIIRGAKDEIVPESEPQAYMDAVKDTAKSSLFVEIADADHGYGFYSDQPQVTEELHNALVNFFTEKLQ